MLLRLRPLLVLLLLAGALLPGPAGAAPGSGRYTYSSGQGTLDYLVHVPGRRAPGPRPVVVVLHGGGETADTAATRSRWNRVGDAFGALVVYPEQDPDHDEGRTWDWAGSAAQGRTGREPALIAGVTRTAVARWGGDPRRVYVVGMSAGAGMAGVMAVLYPDLYTAVGLYAGCPFDFVTCAGSSTDADTSAAAAVRAMGSYARIGPVFNAYGGADPIARGTRADLVVPSWLAVADRLDDGTDDGSVSRSAASSRTETPLPPEHPYQVSTFVDRSGCPIAEDWLVHGMAHAWPHGSPGNGQPVDPVSDPYAPDVPTATYLFFQQHQMPAQPRRSTCR